MNETDHIIYNYSEAYGPFPCEHVDDNGKQCKKEAWTALIKPEDFKNVPDDELERPGFILKNGIGKIVCSEHGGC